MANVLAEYQYRLNIITDIRGHLEFMHNTVQLYEQPVVIELGIQAGNSTSALLSAAQLNDGQLWSCDIQDRGKLATERSGGDRRVPEDWWDEPSWHVFCGDDLSVNALMWMPDQCNVLFIDSDHSYEHVLAVLAVYVPRVVRGGIVLLHDTHWIPGDTDLPYPSGPITKALNKYCSTRNLTWEDRPGSYGMGIINIK